MPSFRNSRTTIVAGMILLAAFSTLPATACYCADGHLMLFCAGQHAGSRQLACHSKRLSCCGGERGTSAPADHGDCCHQSDPGKPCGKCCTQIAKSLFTGVVTVAMPISDGQGWAILPVEVVPARTVLAVRQAQLKRIDFGPSVDLVIAFRVLLI